MHIIEKENNCNYYNSAISEVPSLFCSLQTSNLLIPRLWQHLPSWTVSLLQFFPCIIVPNSAATLLSFVCFHSHVTFIFPSAVLVLWDSSGDSQSKSFGDSWLWNKTVMTWRLGDVHFLSLQRNPQKTLRSWGLLSGAFCSTSSQDIAVPAPRQVNQPAQVPECAQPWGQGQGQKSAWPAEGGKPIPGKGRASATFLIGGPLGRPRGLQGTEASTPALSKEAWLADEASTCHCLEEQEMESVMALTLF